MFVRAGYFIQVSRSDGASPGLDLNRLAVAAECFDCMRQDSRLGLIGSHRYGRLRLPSTHDSTGYPFDFAHVLIVGRQSVFAVAPRKSSKSISMAQSITATGRVVAPQPAPWKYALGDSDGIHSWIWRVGGMTISMPAGLDLDRVILRSKKTVSRPTFLSKNFLRAAD